MKAEDIVQISGISAVLTHDKDRIRKSSIANKYVEDIQELYDYIDAWIKRKEGKFADTKKKK